MKEDIKMKENLNAEPKGTMPQVGAMQHMQAAPNVSPAQSVPNVMPAQQSNAGVMPSMNVAPMPSMNMMPMPVMMCCPYLMNMQCPMTYGQNVMGMGMMNNPMLQGVSPVAGNISPAAGAANNGMTDAAGMGMGSMPMPNQFYPMGGF